MKLKTQTRIFAEVEDCPRCGHDHSQANESLVLFYPLTNPQRESGEAEFWAFCPEVNEPILAYAKDLN